MSSISFAGQRAIVTGAGVVIGRAHAHELAKRGAAVLVNDADRAAADRVAAEIKEAGGTAVANYDPVGTRETAKSIVEHAADELGGVDILINNAGVRGHNMFEDLTEQQITSVMEVHLMASIYLTQAAWPLMQRQRFGRVVMTSSGSGLFSHQGLANYAAAKAGIYGLVKALAYEGEEHDIKVNGLLPIAPDVEQPGRKPPIPKFNEEFARHVSTDLIAKMRGANQSPEMISNIALYLCSRECEVSGESFSICMGRYARVFVAVSDGWLSRPDEQVTPESIRDHLPEIRDVARYSVPNWIYDEMAEVAARL